MAQRPKPKTKARARSKPNFDDKAQFERFVETARKLGAEEVGPAFDDVFGVVVPPRRASIHSVSSPKSGKN